MEGNSTNGASTNGHESVVNSKKVPPSVTKPAPKKRIDIGKMYRMISLFLTSASSNTAMEMYRINQIGRLEKLDMPN
jgi:hypothetical protein